MMCPVSSYRGGRARSLDRYSPVPLWSQLLDDLCLRVARGELDKNFPTDQALMLQYKVSRQTVREAMYRLVSKGIVERERGRRSTVRYPIVDELVDKNRIVYEAISVDFTNQESEIIVLDERVDRAISSLLEWPATTTYIFIERVHRIDNRPTAMERIWLPADAARELLKVDFNEKELSEQLREKCKIIADGGQETIRPVALTRYERMILQTAHGEAGFVVDRDSYMFGRVVEVRRIVFRNDSYSLATRFGPYIPRVQESMKQMSWVPVEGSCRSGALAKKNCELVLCNDCSG